MGLFNAFNSATPLTLCPSSPQQEALWRKGNIVELLFSPCLLSLACNHLQRPAPDTKEKAKQINKQKKKKRWLVSTQ